MEESIAIEKIRNSVEIATKKLILINDEERISQDKDYEEHVYARRGSFLNAMIYHELVSNNSFAFNDVHMECLYPGGDPDEVVDFHIKNIFRNRSLEEFYIEVKHIRYGCEYEDVAIPRMMNSVICDMDKLETIINSKNSIPAVGIMIVANLTRYPGNPNQYESMDIMIDCLKKLITQWKYSDDMVFIISDNFRAISITAGEIKRYKA